MIERVELETDTDLAALAGRATLLGGAAYGLYNSGLPNFYEGHFRRSMSRVSNLNKGKSPNPVETGFGFRGFFGETFRQENIKARTVGMSDLQEIMTGGYKGRSSGLFSEVEGLYSDLTRMYGKDLVTTQMYGSDLIRIKAGKDKFDIPIVSERGEVVLGKRFQNRYVARSVVKDVGESAVELEGLDVALARKYRDELGRIRAGEISPSDIKRIATDRAIWEETRGVRDVYKTASPALSDLRKEQALVDPFRQFSQERLMGKMRDVMRIPGYGGGSAGMFSGGIIATPESLLAKGLPGAEATGSAYQLIRPSAFDGARSTSVDWLGKEGLGQFTIATINDMESFKRAAKKTGLNIGELAAEEALLNNTADIGIRNRMYNFTIDTNREQTRFAKDLMRDLYNEAERVGLDPKTISKAMTSPGSLNKSVQEKVAQAFEGVDLNKKLQRLQKREAELTGDIAGLINRRRQYTSSEGKAVITKQIEKKIAATRQVRSAIRDFGLLGYEPITGAEVRIPGNELSNYIRNISRDGEKLSIATETHFKMGGGSKLFTGGGGGKWTIKSQADVPTILALMEQEKLYNKTGITEDLGKLRGLFEDVQLLSAEAPVRVKQGVLPPRESMTAIMSYASNVMKDGTPGQIKRLEELGIEGGKFTGSSMDARQMISKIKSWHKDESISQIFGGEEFLSSKVTEMVMAPDISSTQAGVGKSGGISERAAYNLQAMGLEGFLEDIMSRKGGGHSAFAQMEQLKAADSIMEDIAARGRNVEQFAGDLGALFQSDIEGRRQFLGGKDLATINLGKRLGGLDKITVFASDAMQPFIGDAPSGGMSELDRSTRDLMQSILRGEDESFQLAKAKKYKAAIADVEMSVSKNMFKGKVKGSMYGQAVSALEGMDEAAAELRKATGIKGDVSVPLIAMSERDVHARFGKEAAAQAAEGQLWGLMTREPIEGVHSNIPVNIRLAEEFGGAPSDLKGAVYISGEDASKDLIRKSMFVDFDKDTVNVIAAQSAKAKESILDFFGAEGRAQTSMGAEYFESLKRMAAFELKGRAPLDLLNLTRQELVGINAAQKQLEKASIGSFSEAFKNIHIGLREQMTPTMGKAASEAFYLGEDFSHLFLENILKAKHQSKEALIANSVQDVLSLFGQKRGTPYASMGKGERAAELQRIFDELTFDSKETADLVRRESAGDMTEAFAERIGFSKQLAEARRIEDSSIRSAEINNVLDKATKQKNAFKKVSSMRNIENVLEAYDLGRINQSRGDYALGIAQRNISKIHSSAEFIKDIASSTSSFMTRGLKNIGKYGILPTAGIGLAASLSTKPKILQPAADTGKAHEREYQEGIGQASAGKTLFSIPEPKFDSYQIAGQANAGTNFEALRAYSQANMRNTNVRLKDHRSHADKYTVEEMVEKGY